MITMRRRNLSRALGVAALVLSLGGLTVATAPHGSVAAAADPTPDPSWSTYCPLQHTNGHYVYTGFSWYLVCPGEQDPTAPTPPPVVNRPSTAPYVPGGTGTSSTTPSGATATTGATAASAGATSGDRIANTIRNFIAPIVLLAIGIAALSLLWKRQMTEFLQFTALTIGVAVFFYVPGVVEKVATTVANAF